MDMNSHTTSIPVDVLVHKHRERHTLLQEEINDTDSQNLQRKAVLSNERDKNLRCFRLLRKHVIHGQRARATAHPRERYLRSMYGERYNLFLSTLNPKLIVSMRDMGSNHFYTCNQCHENTMQHRVNPRIHSLNVEADADVIDLLIKDDVLSNNNHMLRLILPE